MKLLITGMNGTVAPVVATYLSSKGHIIIPLDRDMIDVSDIKALKDYVERAKPEWILHIATGPMAYATDLATIAKTLNINYLYTSTVMVFDESQKGPYGIKDKPEPKSEYGIYKYESEQAILKIKPDAQIIRLGWQIGDHPSGNQMIAYLKKQMQDHGFIQAPDAIQPACSFIIDSAKAILEVMDLPKGIYQCDSNDGYSQYEIFEYLKSRHPWIVTKKVTSPKINRTMKDDRITVKKLSTYMKE
jgi:dTDP-4-dehydrorhamnose reductase